MTIRRPVLFLLVILTLLACLPINAAPKNVILMIGDGMGVAQVALARQSLSESSPPLNMDSMKFAALVKTYAADSFITDSAAAGTALATGFKTNNGMISVLPDGKPVQTILEASEKLGKSTGLVTTTTITHATPASFGSHVVSRGSEADIAPQYLANKIEVILGGGRAYFIPKSSEKSNREDDRDLLAEAKSAGYAVVDSRDGLISAGGDKLLGLFQMGSLTTESPEPSIAEMTSKAIDVLSKDKDGFFLMVEGGQIDFKCHANDAPGVIKQLTGFDAAIGKALDFARKQGNTLVIVTADHETGGLSIVYPDKDSGMQFKAAWTTTGHTACTVPLFADGPNADRFSGVLNNTDVPKKIAELWNVKLQ